MENGKLVLKNNYLFLLLIPSFLFSFQLTKKEIKKLKNGDLIFRRENNLLSTYFAKFNSSYYSHTGIIFYKNNIPYVIHIEGSINKKSDIQIQTLQSFLKDAIGIKIMRLKKKLNLIKFFKILNIIKKKQIKFDYLFDLNSKNKLYCTEFVNYFYYLILNKNLYSNLGDIKNHKVILIKNLINSPYLKIVLKER